MSEVLQFRPRGERTIAETIADSDAGDRVRLVDDIALGIHGIADVVGENDAVEATIDALMIVLEGQQVSKDARLAAKIETLAGKFH